MLESKILEMLGRQEWMEAAILVPSFQQGGQDYLLLTRRTEEVEHHKGQICFPGGMRDPNDSSLWDTALREAYEEIGLEPSKVTRVKELSPQITPTGFRVIPYVATIEPASLWKPSLSEIAEIFFVPVAHLREPKNVHFAKKSFQGVEFIEPHFTYLHHDIWGMTGRVICEFLEILTGPFI